MKNRITNLGFSAAVLAISFIEGLQKGAEWGHDITLDPRDDNGNWTTDGKGAIGYAVSVVPPAKAGEKKGSRGAAVMNLMGDQFDSFVDALDAYDPEADLSGLSPAECVERTIATDKDGNVTFKTSLASHSRTIKVPADQWDDFKALMRANAGTVGDAVEHFRGIAEQLEASESKAPAPSPTADTPSV